MSYRYAYDLYPVADPKDGALVRRFVYLQSAAYRAAANGTGSGIFELRGNDVDAAFIDPAGMQYVRVVEINTAVADGGTESGFAEKVVGGFFLEDGDFELLNTHATKLLKFTGAGPLSVLQRSRMWSHSYLTVPFNGTDPQPDGTWPLHLAGTGNSLGAMLWRVITEAKGFENPAVDPDDRTESAIPFVTMDFDYEEDSDGNPWTVESGDFVVNVGDTVLSVVERLMAAGLYVEMNPDTFVLSAWEIAVHRATRDRTGGSWGSGVVRFQAPTGGDITTGNILSDARRAIHARIRRSIILAGEADTFGTATDSGAPVPWEGYTRSEAADATVLSQLAQTELSARSDKSNTLTFPLDILSDPNDGYYVPFTDINLDELASVHTGTGQFDMNEAEMPVAALSLVLPRGGVRWRGTVELGATFMDSETAREFQEATVGAHSHKPNPELCRPLQPSGPGELVNAHFDSNFNPGNYNVYGNVDLMTDPVIFIIAHILNGGGTADPSSQVPICNGGAITPTLMPGSEVVNGNWGQCVWYVVDPPNGMTVSVPNGYHSFVLYENVDQTNPVGDVFIASGASAVASLPSAFDGFNSMWAWGGGNVGAPNETTGQTEMWSQASGFWEIGYGGSHGTTAPSWSLGGSKNWTIVGWTTNLAGGSTGVGDGHADLVGVGNRASRCDHRHDVHRDRAPNATDDGAHGYGPGVIWAQLDDLDTPTEIVAVWMCADSTDGAAVWLEWPGGTPDHDDLGGVTANQHHNENHASRHASGGADSVKLDDLAAPDDNTDLNASTTKHGLLKKLSGVASEYMDGSGNWSTPAGGGGGGGGASPLAVVRYAPGSDAAHATTTSAIQGDVDATNAKVVFDAPASGKVIVSVRAAFGVSSNQNAFLGLREGTTNIAGPSLIHNGPTANLVMVTGRDFYLTGLSAGSHTYKMAWSVAGGATLSVYAGPTYGPIEITVWDAEPSGGGGSGSTSEDWWHHDNAPASPHAENREFIEGTTIGTLTRVSHGTPHGTWSEEIGGLVWVHSASFAGSEADVFAIPATISVGDYITIAASCPPYNPSYIGPTVGFSNGTTFGTSDAVLLFNHNPGGGTYRHMLNYYQNMDTRQNDGTAVDMGHSPDVWGWRVKYEAANTWGLYIRAPRSKVWRKIQSNYAQTLTPTHFIFGIVSLAAPAYSADNGAGVRLECVRIND